MRAERWDELRRIRGTYIEKFVNHESFVEICIAAYFKIPSDRGQRFHEWVLAPLRAQQRIEILGEIVEVVPELVGIEVAVPRLTPAVR